MKNKEKPARISDAAVQAKTRKTWKQWFKILDAAEAKKMSHTEIVKYLYEKLKVPGWWNQMIAVEYEKARGLRKKYQRPGGYEISISKVIEVPIATLYKSWNDEKIRKRWLPESITIRKATPNKSMRITWTDAKTSLSVDFYSKGKSKSQVVVQHLKLANPVETERMKSFWKKALERLQGMLPT